MEVMKVSKKWMVMISMKKKNYKRAANLFARAHKLDKSNAAAARFLNAAKKKMKK